VRKQGYFKQNGAKNDPKANTDIGGRAKERAEANTRSRSAALGSRAMCGDIENRDGKKPVLGCAERLIEGTGSGYGLLLVEPV
jgi:hypothetical protein